MNLELKQLTRMYGKQDGIRNINLNIGGGETIGLLGLNGAGKTTLLKLMAGMLLPTSGSVTLDGVAPRGARQDVCFLSEQSFALDWLSPKNAHRLMQGLFPQSFNPERLKELLAFFEVPNKTVKTMSLGNKAKFRLALGLSRNAKIYLLDEPLGGLDVIVRDKILRSLVATWNEQAALIVSTHEVAEAEGIFGRAVFIKQGSIVLDTDTETLRQNGSSVLETFKEVLA